MQSVPTCKDIYPQKEGDQNYYCELRAVPTHVCRASSVMRLFHLVACQDVQCTELS
jgi:hypothetical protein